MFLLNHKKSAGATKFKVFFIFSITFTLEINANSVLYWENN